jgi:hypothetical protein
MVGWELIAGYLAAWAVRKVKRIGARADEEVDRVVDLAMDRLHNLVASRLGSDSAMERMRSEALTGEVTPLTQQRVQLSLQATAESDTSFAREMNAAACALQSAQTASGTTIMLSPGAAAGTITGAVTIHAEGGSVAGWQVAGDVAGKRDTATVDTQPDLAPDNTIVHAAHGATAAGTVDTLVLQQMFGQPGERDAGSQHRSWPNYRPPCPRSWAGRANSTTSESCSPPRMCPARHK